MDIIFSCSVARGTRVLPGVLDLCAVNAELSPTGQDLVSRVAASIKEHIVAIPQNLRLGVACHRTADDSSAVDDDVRVGHRVRAVDLWWY